VEEDEKARKSKRPKQGINSARDPKKEKARSRKNDLDTELLN